MELKTPTRVFVHKENNLTDPNPKMSPDRVLSFYMNQYPELTTASIQGPEIKGDNLVYKFITAVGTKG